MCEINDRPNLHQTSFWAHSRSHGQGQQNKTKKQPPDALFNFNWILTNIDGTPFYLDSVLDPKSHRLKPLLELLSHWYNMADMGVSGLKSTAVWYCGWGYGISFNTSCLFKQCFKLILKSTISHICLIPSSTWNSCFHSAFWGIVIRRHPLSQRVCRSADYLPLQSPDYSIFTGEMVK